MPESNPYKYILLDWDGNLAKTLDVWLQASHDVLAKYGVTLSDRQVGESFGHFPSYYQKLGLNDPQKISDEVCDLALERLPGADLYPDALPVLEHLHASGRKLALVTTSKREAITPALERLKLTHLFAAVVTADDVTHHKPNPEPLAKALAALGGSKEQAVMIGDTEKDVQAAHALGIDSILFMPPEHAKFYDFEVLQASHPTHLISNFQAVTKLIAKP